jgi:LAS superfamily LD-carboxypeptidase LdcB/cell division protein FtsL
MQEEKNIDYSIDDNTPEKDNNKKKNKPRSHAKPKKILWGRIFICVILIILLIVILIGAISMLFVGKDTKNGENNTENSSQAVENTTEKELTSSINEIIPSQTGLILVPGKSTTIALQVDATSTEDFENIQWSSSNPEIATVNQDGCVTGVGAGTCTVTASCHQVSADINVTVRKVEVSDGITYIDGIMIVNKIYSLPESYNPGDITSEVKQAFEEMSEAAAKENLDLYIGSSFRTYEYQVEIFDNYSAIYGEEKANTFSSKPGHSEHQSGLSIDCNTIDSAFGDTLESEWLSQHAAEYGFIIRYPQGKEDITGYEYEPWHIRYVGREIAEEIYNNDLCLEEYLGIAGDTEAVVTSEVKSSSNNNIASETEEYSALSD